MKIESEKFVLRPLNISDADSLAGNADDKKIADNLRAFPNPYTKKDAEEFISAYSGKDNVLTISLDGKASGCIGWFQGHNVERLSAEVGYWLGKEHRGKGIMTEAVKVLSRYIFDNTPIIRLYAVPFEYNPASMRVLEKAGFTKLAVLRKAGFKNGKIFDLHYYELLKE